MPDYKYKCVQSFKSSYTFTSYLAGTKITSSEYNALPYVDRNNFSILREEEGYGSTGYIRFDDRDVDTKNEING